MFGYVKPYKLELKLKSIYQYKSLYCGLCYHLRHNYGQLYGCILSYDITFLLTVLNALDMKKKRLNFRCPLNPFMKIEADISEKALDYAAFINYYLIYLKVEDDIMDENSILKKIVKIILKKNHKFLNKLEYYKSVADNLKNNMQQFNDFEKKETNFDDLTNCFGKLFSSIFIDFFENLELDTKIQFIVVQLSRQKSTIFIMN